MRAVTSERDRLEEMYSDTKNELQRVREQLVRATPSMTPSLAAQRVLKQVELVCSLLFGCVSCYWVGWVNSTEMIGGTWWSGIEGIQIKTFINGYLKLAREQSVARFQTL